MRVNLISAHYPPNFVSGGTLQPQRLARGLAARGHEVRVFAGYLDSERPALDTWEEVDEAGVAIRWIVTTPFMDWADPDNYDNPAVTEAFAAELTAHPADVVHVHALQTLGVGLLEVAARAGARTVVTMHDFWWSCARQFLVDRGVRPCSLVVSAGDCACEDGRAHLETRAARLHEALRSADLVLAPSRSAAAVLEANGVDPSRLRVDENGMEAAVAVVRPHRDHTAGTPVVLRYTGGSNPMKGAEVLLDAAAALGPRDDLRIVAHDLDEAAARRGLGPGSTALELAPPYAPDDLDAVLAATDALLLPSVMRESHSLVTREALLRGVPVITTDTIGPEEVVEDGVNGLVIPAGDSALLRRAITTVLDPAILARLQAGARTPPPIRSIDEQLDGLEATYAELTPGPSEDRATWTPRRVLFVVGIDGAPLRYRARLPAEGLALLDVPSDVRHYRDPDVDALADQADAVIVYRVPATHQVLALVERVRARGAVVAFDVDDLIFDPDLATEIPALFLLPAEEAALWLEGVRRYRTTMEACGTFIGSTPRLVEHAAAVVGVPAHLFPNGVGAFLGAASDIALRRDRRPGPLRVGYLSGTTTHQDDWLHVEGAVLAALDRHPTAELWLGGHLEPSPAVVDRLGTRLVRLPFQAWDQLPELLRDLDVNLAPLEPGSRFNDAKSAIKWLEAAIVATPTIASPSGPFREAIEDGRSGWLADEPAAWTEALDAALGDSDARRLVGARARRAALLGWSPHRQGHRYLAVLRAIHAAGLGHPGVAGWHPVVLDEPPTAVGTALEPYPPTLVGSTRWRRRPKQRHPWRAVTFKAGRLRATLRDDGPGAVVSGAGRVARRVAGRVTSRGPGPR